MFSTARSAFFRGRQSDGNWSAPFEEFATGRDYTEATPWHYRFFVPHDVNGLIQLFGSRETFIREMDRLFTLESDEMQLDVSDVTGADGAVRPRQRAEPPYGLPL